MALRTPPSWLQAGSHPAENDRNYTRAFVTGEGVRGAADFAVASLGGMNLSVAGGYGFVFGTVTAAQGAYGLYNDGAVTLTVATAHPTLPRIDRVVAVVNDSAYGSVVDNAVLQIISGTAAASPVAPAIPPNSLSLATIAVAAAATSLNSGNITDTRKRLLSSDGVEAFTNEAARTLGIPTPTTGLVTYVGDTGTETPSSTIPQIQAYTGAAWQNTDGLTLLASSTFTTAGSWTFDNVFNSTFENYLIKFRISAASATDPGVFINGRVAGGDSNANMQYHQLFFLGTVGVSNGTTPYIGNVSANYASYGYWNLEVHSPNLPVITRWQSENFYLTSSGGSQGNLVYGHQQNNSQWDGIKIFPATGTLSGNVRIYGLRNS